MKGRKTQIMQECTNPGLLIAPETKFCTVALNICGSSMWILLYVTLLSPWILEWLVSFWKVCAPLKRCTEANNDVFPRELTYISVPYMTYIHLRDVTEKRNWGKLDRALPFGTKDYVVWIIVHKICVKNTGNRTVLFIYTYNCMLLFTEGPIRW